MTQLRQKGLLNLLMGSILLIDCLLFQLSILADGWFNWVGLVASARPEVYLIAVLLPLLRPPKRLVQVIETPSVTGLLNAVNIALSISVTMGLAFSLIYVTLKDTATSRFFLLCFLAFITPVNVALVRYLPGILVRTFFPQKSMDQALLVGDGSIPESLIEYTQKCANLGIHFLGYYSDREDEDLPIPYLGTMEDFYEANLEALRLDRILAYNSDSSSSEFGQVVELCQRLGIRLQMYTRFTNFDDPITIVQDGDLQFLSFSSEPLEDPVNKHMKRVFDISVSLPVVVFVLPVLSVVVWCVQRLQSPGPLLFRQERYGRRRDKFTIYKFRTMHVRKGDDEAKQATKGDSRVYLFGSFLRRTSLDEFPQFANVLKGEMSIIGPRPHLVEHDAAFEKVYRTYRSRHFVKPGITGYAQIKGYRGEVKDMDMIVNRVRSDIHYVNNWSLGLDIYILFRTVWQVIVPPKSAY